MSVRWTEAQQAAIDMSRGDREEPRRPEQLSGLGDQTHGERGGGAFAAFGDASLVIGKIHAQW